MLFNPELTKQAQEVLFSRKNIKTDHPFVYFNEDPVVHTTPFFINIPFLTLAPKIV